MNFILNLNFYETFKELDSLEKDVFDLALKVKDRMRSIFNMINIKEEEIKNLNDSKAYDNKEMNVFSMVRSIKTDILSIKSINETMIKKVKRKICLYENLITKHDKVNNNYMCLQDDYQKLQLKYKEKSEVEDSIYNQERIYNERVKEYENEIKRLNDLLSSKDSLIKEYISKDTEKSYDLIKMTRENKEMTIRNEENKEKIEKIEKKYNDLLIEINNLNDVNDVSNEKEEKQGRYIKNTSKVHKNTEKRTENNENSQNFSVSSSKTQNISIISEYQKTITKMEVALSSKSKEIEILKENLIKESIIIDEVKQKNYSLTKQIDYLQVKNEEIKESLQFESEKNRNLHKKIQSLEDDMKQISKSFNYNHKSNENNNTNRNSTDNINNSIGNVNENGYDKNNSILKLGNKDILLENLRLTHIQDKENNMIFEKKIQKNEEKDEDDMITNNNLSIFNNDNEVFEVNKNRCMTFDLNEYSYGKINRSQLEVEGFSIENDNQTEDRSEIKKSIRMTTKVFPNKPFSMSNQKSNNDIQVSISVSERKNKNEKQQKVVFETNTFPLNFDYLYMNNNKEIEELMEREKEDSSLYEIYSDYIYEIKDSSISKKRLFINGHSIYIIRQSNKVKYKYKLDDLLKISLSSKYSHLIVFHFDDNHEDFMFESPRRIEIINYLKGLKKIPRYVERINNIKIKLTDTFKIRRNKKCITVNLKENSQMNNYLFSSFGNDFSNYRLFGYIDLLQNRLFSCVFYEKICVLCDLGLLIYEDFTDKNPKFSINIINSTFYPVEISKYNKENCFEILDVNKNIHVFHCKGGLNEVKLWINEFYKVKDEFNRLNQKVIG